MIQIKTWRDELNFTNALLVNILYSGTDTCIYNFVKDREDKLIQEVALSAGDLLGQEVDEISCFLPVQSRWLRSSFAIILTFLFWFAFYCSSQSKSSHSYRNLICNLLHICWICFSFYGISISLQWNCGNTFFAFAVFFAWKYRHPLQLLKLAED